MNKPYKIPDPRLEPEKFLVLVYKTMKSIKFDNREWDVLYFGRCMKRMKQFLEIFENDLQKAARCLQELKNDFEAKGISWTIETIIRYSFEWKAEQERVTERQCLQGLLGAYKSDQTGLQPANLDGLLKQLSARTEETENKLNVI